MDNEGYGRSDKHRDINFDISNGADDIEAGSRDQPVDLQKYALRSAEEFYSGVQVGRFALRTFGQPEGAGQQRTRVHCARQSLAESGPLCVVGQRQFPAPDGRLVCGHEWCTLEALTEYMAQEMARWGKVVKDIDIKIE